MAMHFKAFCVLIFIYQQALADRPISQSASVAIAHRHTLGGNRSSPISHEGSLETLDRVIRNVSQAHGMPAHEQETVGEVGALDKLLREASESHSMFAHRQKKSAVARSGQNHLHEDAQALLERNELENSGSESQGEPEDFASLLPSDNPYEETLDMSKSKKESWDNGDLGQVQEVVKKMTGDKDTEGSALNFADALEKYVNSLKALEIQLKAADGKMFRRHDGEVKKLQEKIAAAKEAVKEVQAEERDEHQSS